MFDGFTEDKDGAIELSNAIHKSFSFGLMGITLGQDIREENKLNIGGGGNAIGVDSWARGLLDVDGSVTGTPGAITYKLSSDRDGSRIFNAGKNYEIIEEWGAIVSYGTRSGTLRINDLGTNEENTGNESRIDKSGMVVTRSDGAVATGIRVQIPVFIDYSYDIAYDEIEDDFRLYLHDMDWGDSIIVSLPSRPTGSSLIVDDPYSSASDPAREVTSMAMLKASPDTAAFRDADGGVHVKLVAEMAHGCLWPQPGAAMLGSLHSGVTVLVDTTANLNLNRLEFDDPEPGEALGPPPYAEGQDDEPTPNSRPEAGDDAVTISTDGEADVDVLAYDSDPDGDVLTFSRVEASDGMTAELHQGGVLVTPEAGFSGEALVEYSVSDGNGGVDTAEIMVTVESAPVEDPVDDADDDDPADPGATATAFVESDGRVMIEPESYGELPEGWFTKSDYDWAAAPDVGATGGKNDFVIWHGEDQSDAPGASILSYYVVIENTGLYEFNVCDQPATDRPEVGGDLWVEIDGDKFYRLDGDSSMYPEGAAPGSFPDDAVPLPAADGEDGEDGWMRCQSTNRSTHWGSGGHVNDTGQRSERHDIVVEFDMPGVFFAIQFSGATPSSHVVGSFGLINTAMTTDFDLQGEESDRVTVTLDEDAPPPADEPETENRAPEAEDDTMVPADGGRCTANVLANDSDPHGDALNISEVDAPDGMDVSIRNDGLWVTAEDGFTGDTLITYTIIDGEGGETTATLAVTVEPPANRGPDAADDAVSLSHGGSSRVDVLDNDTDPDGDVLTITKVNAPDGLTASIRGDRVIVSAEGNAFSGDAIVTYEVSDGRGGTDTAKITVSVEQAPETDTIEIALALVDTALDTTITSLEDGAVMRMSPSEISELSIMATADGSAVDSMAFPLDDGPLHVENHTPYALFGDNGGDFHSGVLAPGRHELTAQAFSDDRAGGTMLGQTTISFEIVEEIPDLAPILEHQDLVLLGDSGARRLVLSVEDLAHDPEGQPMIFHAAEAVGNGELTISGDGKTLSYKPNPGFSGRLTTTPSVARATSRSPCSWPTGRPILARSSWSTATLPRSTMSSHLRYLAISATTSAAARRLSRVSTPSRSPPSQKHMPSAT